MKFHNKKLLLFDRRKLFLESLGGFLEVKNIWIHSRMRNVLMELIISVKDVLAIWEGFTVPLLCSVASPPFSET